MLHVLVVMTVIIMSAHTRAHSYTHAHMHTCTHAHMHTCAHAHTSLGFARQKKTVFEGRGGIYFKNPDKAHKSGEQAGRGYMHMIRLYSGMLFQHPVLHAFANYMRLDTDSFFVGETKVWIRAIRVVAR